MLGCVELLTASAGSYRGHGDSAVWHVLEGVLACSGLYWYVVLNVLVSTGTRMGRYQNIKCSIQAKYMPEYMPIRAGMYSIHTNTTPPYWARIDARIQVCIRMY